MDHETLQQILNILGNINWLVILYVVNFFIAVLIVYRERRDSAATIAWLAVLFALPALGIVLYAFFSQNISRRRIYHLTEKEEYLLSSSLKRQQKEIAEGSFDYRNSEIIQGHLETSPEHEELDVAERGFSP